MTLQRVGIEKLPDERQSILLYVIDTHSFDEYNRDYTKLLKGPYVHPYCSPGNAHVDSSTYELLYNPTFHVVFHFLFPLIHHNNRLHVLFLHRNIDSRSLTPKVHKTTLNPSLNIFIVLSLPLYLAAVSMATKGIST